MSSTLLARRRPSAPNIKTKRSESQKPKATTIRETPPTHLQTFDQLPPWYQDNPYVLSHYRPVSHSYLSCLHSLTYLHNETLNIYTHLIPAILTLLSLFIFNTLINTHYPLAPFTDRLVFLANLFTASITATLSATYHTLMSHSHPTSHLCLRIDYAGILLLIFTSFISGIHVGFYTNPSAKYIHFTSITLLTLVTALLVLHPHLQGVRHRTTKTVAFVTTALTGFAPITHGLLLYGWEAMWVRKGMKHWFLEAGVYLVGSVFFATRFPERVWPGRFDVWGGSHQIFHLLVVLGAAVHVLGLWDAWQWTYRDHF